MMPPDNGTAGESVPGESLDGLFEINDPEIDVDRIMDEIRRRIQERRQTLGYDKRSFPIFGAAAYPGEPGDIPYDPTLYYHLRIANETYAQVPTAPQLAPSPATRLPVVGRVWGRVRGLAHELVLFYVNRHVAHETNLDRQVISVLNRLAALTAQQQRQIEALQAEIKALRSERGF
jgi:hypothetical protein